MSEYREVPNKNEVLHHYPHIAIKLCDGEIINAESGERIINLSQFMVTHNLDVMDPIELDHQSQLSQQLVIDSNYLVSISEDPTDNQESQSSQFEIDNRPPSQTLSQLNQSLIDHEETVLATSAPSSQSFEPAQTSLVIPSSNQRSTLYDEAVNTLDTTSSCK